MKHQNVIFTNSVGDALNKAVEQLSPRNVFVLTDENVERESLASFRLHSEWQKIVIPAGDINKNLDSAQAVWNALQNRGIRFINIPTTLLSAVDAAVGGKTGVNFNGLKNEIGVFKEAETVIISTVFFSTLPERELKSGYAEMLKHGLLDGEAVYNKLLDYDFDNVAGNGLLRLVKESVNVKRRIVEQDPFEQGLRRALNLGHTAGHAFESLALKRDSPVPHGYAVAWGMVVEAVLSHTEKGFPSAELYRLADYVCRHYGAFHITCDDYPELIEFMRHDKKSEHGELNFTLLHNVGNAETGCEVDVKQVEAALDIYRDLMHI